MRAPFIASARAMYESYFARRLLEELMLADKARNTRERRARLIACRHYRELLGLAWHLHLATLRPRLAPARRRLR
jgi:hypothetical protein